MVIKIKKNCNIYDDKGDDGDYDGNIINNNYGWSICDINNIDGKNTGYRMIIIVIASDGDGDNSYKIIITLIIK